MDTWRDELDLDLARAAGKDGPMVQKLEGGAEVTYTLDSKLQAKAIKYLQRYEVPYGAMVLYRIDSGDVLVMAGHSQDDPKVDLEQLTLSRWAPAASVFKVVTAAALLDQGVPSNTSVCYHGGHRGLRSHHLRENAAIDTTCHTLKQAIARSINPIMAKLSDRYLNQSRLRTWSERFGFNRRFPFDLQVQPSRAKIPAGRLDRARVAAGFWHTEMSVLHGAVISGIVANAGRASWPRVIRTIKLKGGRVIIPTRPSGERVMSSSNARSLGDMMTATTVIGSGRRGFISRRGRPFLGDVSVAGKTGSLSRNKPFLQYSWFVGYAPADKPEVAFAVLLGNPARWRIKASIAARVMLQQYFARQKELKKKQQRKIRPTAKRTPAPKTGKLLAKK